jgi:hypothetical protein
MTHGLTVTGVVHDSTKYTHLADQDTSTRDSLWLRNDRVRDKYTHKMAGMRELETKRRKKE